MTFQIVEYVAHRDVNEDQWRQHTQAWMRATGDNYPPEDASVAPLATFYWYWCEGDGRNRFANPEAQDMGVYVEVADARDADGASAAEVLAALLARGGEVRGTLKARYGEAIGSLSRALAGDSRPR